MSSLDITAHYSREDVPAEGHADGPRSVNVNAGFADARANQERSRLELEHLRVARREEEKRRQEDVLFERSICVSVLTERDFNDVLGQEWKSRPPNKADFSDDKYKLETLTGPWGGLLNKDLKRRRLTYINISDNRLHDINVLSKVNGFEAVSTLLAKRNLIGSCSLNLPKLIELNLAYNQLTQLPRLDHMPLLEVLMLSHNQISGTVEGVRESVRIKRLDLAYNQFDFNPTQLSKTLSQFARLRNLQELRLYNNPFVACFKEYQVFVIRAIPTLRILDDVDMKEYADLIRYDIKEARISELPVYDDAVKKRQVKEQYEQQDRKAEDQSAAAFGGEGLPRLATIVDYLEEVVDDVTVLQRNIHLVHDTAKRRAQHIKAITDLGDFFWEDLVRDEHGKVRAKEKATKEDYEAAVSRTLELIDLVMERHDSVRNILIETLGWLTSVSRYKFGKKCLLRLGRLMLACEADKAQVLHTLENIVVPCLRSLARAGNEGLNGRRTKDLILGIVVLLEIPGQRAEVARVLQKLIPMFLEWMNSSEKAQDLQDGEHIIHALAALTDDPENNALVASESVARKCVAAINNQSYALSDKFYGLWLDFLHLTGNLVQYSETNQFLDFFLKDSVHVTVISRGRAILGEGGIDDSTQKARMVSRIVRFVATLMKKDEQVHFDCCNSYHFTEYLYTLLKDTSDPLVLAEGCRCLLVVFENQTIYVQQGLKVINELTRLTQFLKFLGAERYHEIVACASRHQFADGSGYAEAPPLAHLDDPLVCDAFVAIINLFAFFAREENTTSTFGERDELRELVNTDLNNHGRDQKLLSLLAVQDDEVRLSVMNCVRQVSIDEINTEEMGMLVKCLSDTRNISEGLTEKVLGLVFNFLERLVAANVNAGVQFRQSYAETAIGEGYLILHQNAKRDTYGLESEEEQKLVLSNSIVSFLRACSRRIPLRGHLNSVKVTEMFPDILKCEEEFHRPHAKDVALEQTWTGRSVDNLIKCFQEKDALKRSKRVVFRVLSRIADVMEGVPDFIGGRTEPFMLHELAQKESKMWCSKTIQRNQLHLDDQEMESLQNEAGQVKSRLDTILRHISNMEVRSQERENLEVVVAEARWFEDTFAEGLQKKRALDDKARKQQADDTVKAVNLARDDEDKTEVPLTGNQVLASAIHQFEDVVEGDTGQMFIYRPEQFTTNEETLMDEYGNKLPRFATYKTPYKMNSAYEVCAFLRTLHAVLLVPPTEDCRKQVLDDFRQEDTVARLCALVETIPYLNCNVAAKFLTVMKLVLDTGTSVRYAPPLEILSLISKYIQRIADGLLSLLKLTKDRKLDVRETTLCAAIANVMTITIAGVTASVRQPEHCEEVRKETISKCIDRLAPSVIIRLLIAMIIYDLQMDLGGGERARIQIEFVQQAYTKVAMKDHSTRSLVLFLVHCPQHKYNVLEVFNVADVFNQQSVRPCYLAELLNDVAMGTYLDFVQNHLRSKTHRGLDFRVLNLRRVEAAAPKGPGTVQRLFCVTSETVTMLAPPEARPLYAHGDELTGRWQPAWETGFPRPPTEVWSRPHSDIAGLYKCYGSQLMAIKWKTKECLEAAGAAAGEASGQPALTAGPKLNGTSRSDQRAGVNCGIGGSTSGQIIPMSNSRENGPSEDIVLLCFHRAGTREEFALLLKKMSARSVKSRARIINDPSIRQEVLQHPEVADPTGESVLAASVALAPPKVHMLDWGAKDQRQPQFFVLTLKKVLVFKLAMHNWRPQNPDLIEDIDIENFMPKDLFPENDPDCGADEVKVVSGQLHPQAAQKIPKSNVLKYDGHYDLPPKEVIFKTSPEADLMIKFKDGSLLDIRFYDDTEREHWRRALAYILFKTTQKVWTRDIPGVA